MDIKQMKARIKATTKGFRKEGTTIGEVAKIDVEGVAYKVGTLLGQSGYNKQLAEVFGIITDLDVITPYNNVIALRTGGVPGVTILKFFKPLVAVVPLAVYGGHNYNLNVPVVLSSTLYGKGGYQATGLLGNNLDAGSNDKTIRLATDLEIDALTDAQVKAMINEYT
jgi:hypothetical protein